MEVGIIYRNVLVLVLCIALLSGCDRQTNSSTPDSVNSQFSRSSAVSSVADPTPIQVTGSDTVAYAITDVYADSFSIKATYDKFVVVETYRFDSLGLTGWDATITLGEDGQVSDVTKAFSSRGLRDTDLSYSFTYYSVSISNSPLLIEAFEGSPYEMMLERAQSLGTNSESDKPIGSNQQIIDDGQYHINGVSGSKLILTKYFYRLQRGEQRQITIDSLPEQCVAEDLTFSSDNQKAAVVSEHGVITAIGNGTASISVTLKGATARAVVTVMVVE